MKYPLALAALTASSSLHTQVVYAWGAAGHEIVATIAQVYLHPTALTGVCEVLFPGSSEAGANPPCHISTIAAWADQVRRQPQYRHTAPLHYIGALDDHPPDSCAFPGARGWAGKKDGNVLGAVSNTTGILVDWVEGLVGRDSAEEAVKFLVHYVGDMHMPLHLTGRERGGNGARVQFDGRVTNLHSLWDSQLIAQSLRTIPRNYTHAFPPGSTKVDVETHLRGTIYDPYVRRLMYEGMGIGSAPGRFGDEWVDWLSCPALELDNESVSLWSKVQNFMGLIVPRDEEGWDDDVLCPYSWASEVHKLDCELPVWPRELDQPPYNHFAYSDSEVHTHPSTVEEELADMFDLGADFGGRGGPRHPDLLELDTPHYAGKIRQNWVVERLLTMAGVRLAGILNGVFMPLDSPEFQEGGCVDFPLVNV